MASVRIVVPLVLCALPLVPQLQGQSESSTHQDGELRQQISALFCRTGLPFTYSVEQGVVRLGGEVNTKAERQAIARNVEEIAGVKRTIDHIAIARHRVGAGCGTGMGTGSDVGYGPPPPPK